MQRKILTILFFVLVCAALLATLVACGKELPDDLILTGEDVSDVPAGVYTLPYTVENFEKYKDKYKLDLSVTVYDASNERVEVENNRKITVEADAVYTVLVRLYAENQPIRSHEFFVRAEHSPRTVDFVYDEDELEIDSMSVPYGSSITWEDLPEIPDRIFVDEENDGVGYTEVVDKRWIVYDGSTPRDLAPADLQNITKSMVVYAYLEYRVYAVPVVVHFESNGGTVIEDYHTDTQTPLERQPSPTKEGFAFIGWCFDEECTSFYNWKERTLIPRDFTLYAKYVEANDNVCTSTDLFSYTEHENEYGNPYYSLTAKTPDALTGDLVLPTVYKELPVTDIEENAFEATAITSVFIPASYRLTGQYQFYRCESLVSAIFENGSRSYHIPRSCFADCPALESVTLPSHLRRIQSRAFYGCLSLSSVELPETLMIIDEYAFSQCMSLTSVSAPDALTDIAGHVFDGCAELSELLFGRKSQIRSIADTALDDTAITEIVLPSHLRTTIVFDGDVDRVHISYYSNEE